MNIKYFFLLLSLTISSAYADNKKIEADKKISLGVQLYSVRDDLKKDFQGTLTQLSKMGFEGVEFAGIYGGYEKNPKQLKALLDKLNLKAAGAHVKMKDLRGAALNNTITFFKALNCQFLIVPWDDRVKTEKGTKNLADELNTIAVKLKAHNMKTGYHNHDDEMQTINNTTYWDILANATTSDVILQQDVGWTTFAGKDPIHYVKKYPGRTLSTHYKAKLPKDALNKQPIIGQDTIDWKNLIKANIETGGTQWYILEQEDYPNGLTPLQSVQASIDGFNKIITELKQ